VMDITHSSLFLTCNYNDSWMQYVILRRKYLSKLFVTCKRGFGSAIPEVRHSGGLPFRRFAIPEVRHERTQ